MKIMSPEVNDNETPDQLWLIDETGVEPCLASELNGSTVNSSASLLKLEQSELQKEAMKEKPNHPQFHTLLQQNYMDMKIMKDKRRSRKAKCCLFLAILIILTLSVITLVAATQIFCGNNNDGTNPSKITSSTNNTGEVHNTSTHKATSEVLVYILNDERSNTTKTLNEN